MQDAAFAALGIEARYASIDVPPEGLEGAVAALRNAPWLGANVSVPYKTAVVRWLDELSPTARRLGAVNTIVRRGDRLYGDNSDLSGFARSLADLAVPLEGTDVVVLGAGGAARAVVAALVDLGASVAIHNRTRERADALVADLAPGARVLTDEEVDGAVDTARLLVQTTSVGMAGGPPGSPLPPGVLPRTGAVVDLVYRPPVTPLLAASRDAGLEVRNGLPMLVYQGAVSFEAWTGRSAPVAVMGRAAEIALGGPGRGWTGLSATSTAPPS